MNKIEQPYHRSAILAMALSFIEAEVRRGSNVEEMVRVLKLQMERLRKLGVSLPEIDDRRINRDYVYEIIEIVTGMGISELRKKL